MYRYAILLSLFSAPVYANSVIPNFNQGVLTQRSETKSTVVEDIKSFDNIPETKKLINQMHLYKYSNFIYDKINNIFAASAIFNIGQNYINYKFFYAYS